MKRRGGGLEREEKKSEGKHQTVGGGIENEMGEREGGSRLQEPAGWVKGEGEWRVIYQIQRGAYIKGCGSALYPLQ